MNGGAGGVDPSSEADIEMEGSSSHPQPSQYATELKIHAQEDHTDIHCVALIPEDELEGTL